MAQDTPSPSVLEVRLRALWDIPGCDLAAQAWKWPKEERLMIAKEFKAYLNAGRYGKQEGEQPIQILINLGDRESTEQAVQKYIADGLHFDRWFGSSGSPIAIQYLAPHAFSQEAYSQRGTDVITSPFSFMVTHVIFEILSDSSAFTGEVTNWARKVKAPDPERQRAELQRWWEENKIHFEQEDYKAVKPGLPIPSVFEVADENRRKAGLPPLEEARPKQPALIPLPTTPKPAPAPVAQTPAPAVDRQAPMWPWLVGIAALAVIVLSVWKRRA